MLEVVKRANIVKINKKNKFEHVGKGYRHTQLNVFPSLHS